MSDVNENIGNIELSDEAKDIALKRFFEQMEDWGQAVPNTNDIHVLDFGIDEFEKTGLIEYWIANEFDAGYCAKYLFLFDEQSCPYHWHKNKHETFYILNGSVEMCCDAVKTSLNTGDILPMDVNVKHGFKAIGNALLLEVSKPCFVEDNFFENRKIPLGGNQDTAE